MTPSPTPTEQVSAIVDAHVREIVSAAERAATDLQRDVEVASARRAAEIREAAERDADGIRRAAEVQAQEYLQECRRRSEAFAVGRVARLQELTDGLLAHGEAIRSRLPEAEELHRGLQDLVAALAAAARAATAESARPAVELPSLADAEAERRASAPAVAAAPGPGQDPGTSGDAPVAEERAHDPAPEPIAADPLAPFADPEPLRAARAFPRASATTGVATTPKAPDQVRQIARDLPRLPRRPVRPSPPPPAPEDPSPA